MTRMTQNRRLREQAQRILENTTDLLKRTVETDQEGHDVDYWLPLICGDEWTDEQRSAVRVVYKNRFEEES